MTAGYPTCVQSSAASVAQKSTSTVVTGSHLLQNVAIAGDRDLAISFVLGIFPCAPTHLREVIGAVVEGPDRFGEPKRVAWRDHDPASRCPHDLRSLGFVLRRRNHRPTGSK